MEKKHFSYEGNVNIADIRTRNGKPYGDEKVEVIDVRVLAPAKVILKVGDKTFDKMVNVDLIHREVFDEFGEPFYQEEIFKRLDFQSYIPEEFYAASDEVLEKAAEAQQMREDLKEEADYDW